MAVYLPEPGWARCLQPFVPDQRDEYRGLECLGFPSLGGVQRTINTYLYGWCIDVRPPERSGGRGPPLWAPLWRCHLLAVAGNAEGREARG